MKKARMNISHLCFILFNLKIFGEIVTTITFYKVAAKLYAPFMKQSTTAMYCSFQPRRFLRLFTYNNNNL